MEGKRWGNGLFSCLEVTYGYWFRRAVVSKDLAVCLVCLLRALLNWDRALLGFLFLFLLTGSWLSFGLLHRHARACWKDAPDVQWNDERGLPVFSVLLYDTMGFWPRQDGRVFEEELTAFGIWGSIFVFIWDGSLLLFCKAYGCGFRSGSATT